jgi:uncharacterized protein (TIGR01244 family)
MIRGSTHSEPRQIFGTGIAFVRWGCLMRVALHPHHLVQIVLAIVGITILAVFISECPSLGQNTSPSKVEGFQNEIPNFMLARTGIYTSGQPTEEGFKRLAALHMKTIVNLRAHEEEGARDESQQAAALGMKYVNIPLSATTFTTQKIEELHCVFRDPKSFPVLIHCRSGNRASGAWFAYRVLFENAPIPAALMEAKALGLEPSLETVLLEFVQKARTQKINEVCQVIR